MIISSHCLDVHHLSLWERMTTMTEKTRLSKDLVVACEIYKAEIQEEPIWFSRLVERLSGIMSKKDVSDALDKLFDWGFIQGEYGATENGKAGRIFKIALSSKQGIKALYNGKHRQWIDQATYDNFIALLGCASFEPMGADDK